MLNLDAYLDRINYHGPLEPSAEALHALHRAHLLAIPFENLDIHCKQVIHMDQAALYHKIVVKRRGGFCYELNGLFAALLREIGFQVRLISARVKGRNGAFGPEFDHLALIAPLEQRWLIDVGFGDSFREPIRLDERGAQRQDAGTFRLTEDGGRFTLLRLEGDGSWAERFIFSLEPRRLEDFADMCHYHQTSPESIFTQGRICTRATPDGRITLTDQRLTQVKRGERQETPIAGTAAFHEALVTHFGIDLGD